jgi:hypothetical protein
MREFREYGSARGALSNERPYRDHCEAAAAMVGGAVENQQDILPGELS